MTTTPTYRIERLAPDLLKATIHGDVDAATMEAMMLESAHLFEDGADYISLTDISALGKVSPEARRRAKALASQSPGLRAQITIGGTFAQRVIAKLLMTAMNLITKNEAIYEFCANEEEAMALVERLRARFFAETNESRDHEA